MKQEWEEIKKEEFNKLDKSPCMIPKDILSRIRMRIKDGYINMKNMSLMDSI